MSPDLANPSLDIPRLPPPVADWRREFPALAQQVNGHPIAYLDTAATAQRPNAVIDAITDFYRHDNANPGRTLHTLARRADDRYETARRTLARFIHAADPSEIVWVRGTTEGINLVATAWGGANLGPGNEILLTVADHASCLQPWKLAARRSGATLQILDLDDDGRLPLDRLEDRLSPRTRLVAFPHVSNVLGVINPAREICQRAHRVGARVLIDGAQSAPHFPVDVQALDCDFFAFSGHKMMGPMGAGVLWARRELLDAMPPYQAGSNMAHEVDVDSEHYAEGALKFGAGTPNVSGPVGLAAAVEFIERIGRGPFWEHEQTLVKHALSRFRELKGLRLLGAVPPEERISVFSFALDGIPVPAIVEAMDRRGIAVRGGDLASLPLLRRFGLSAAARASLYLYNTTAEIDRLAEGLEALRG